MFHELKVEVLSVFAFRIANFQQPATEVAYLMELSKEKLYFLAGNSQIIAKYEMQVRVLGDLSLLPLPVRRSAEWIMEATRGNSKSILNICCPYTARYEITKSIQRLEGRGSGVYCLWHTQ